MAKSKALAPAQVEARIQSVRGFQVLLDSDLAAIYGVTTAALNQAVKRNQGRFPGTLGSDLYYSLTGREQEENARCGNDRRNLVRAIPAPRSAAGTSFAGMTDGSRSPRRGARPANAGAPRDDKGFPSPCGSHRQRQGPPRNTVIESSIRIGHQTWCGCEVRLPAMGFRYRAEGVEPEFEPGSGGRVLRNKLGIRSVREMGRSEAEHLLATVGRATRKFSEGHRFLAADVRWIHKDWLSKTYSWAGRYRQVNISKGDVLFAAAREIERLMGEFERRQLAEWTPCRWEDPEVVVKAMAIVHAELVLIHPFREGNGRCARVLATLMGLQAGLPPLDFGGIKDAERRCYFGAVRSALGRDYKPMAAVFRKVVRRTLRAFEA
jgi:cell filamentation protein